MAVTDPLQIIATPLETVLTHELMLYLDAYFQREEVDLLVVGMPKQMDNKESQSMKQIRFFVNAFKRRFTSIPVIWEDERFTSKMALKAMVEGGMKQSDRKKKGNIDKVSAALILQSYLEKRNNIST